MNRRSWLGLGAGILLLGPTGLAACHKQVGMAGGQGERLTVTDDLGRQVELILPIKRTVVFNRYDVEFVRAVGGMDKVVGLDGGTAKERDYWPTVTDAMIVGQGQTEPDYEKVIGLKPDLILVPRNGDWEKLVQMLAPFKIPVVVMTGWDVLKHEQNIDLLGRIYQAPEKAAKLNDFYRHWRDLLKTRLAGVTRKRVYLEEVGQYKTLLKGSGWHDMIELGGGKNVFDDIDITAGKSEGRGAVQGFVVDPEAILARKPDVIIKLEPGQYKSHPRAFSEGMLNGIAARPGFSQLSAVKTGQVYHMSYYLAGGCSKVIGALQIAKWLYPEMFADVNPDDVMTQWFRDFQGMPYPGNYWVSLAQIRGQ